MRSRQWGPPSVFMGENHHGYILYLLLDAGPLGSLHTGRGVGDRSMQVPIPALGAGVFKKLPTGSGIRFAGVEEMGWMPELISRRVWRCANGTTSQAMVRPYAGRE